MMIQSNRFAKRLVSNIKFSMLLRTTPPAAIVTMLFFIPIFGGDSYTEYAGLTFIEQLQNPATVIVLVGAYLACVLLLFKKDFDGYWYWNKKKRMFHKFSFIVFAIIAAAIPYLAATSGFFFNAVDSEFGIMTLKHKVALGVYIGFYYFMSTDMFSSMLGKGWLFRTPQINRSPMKKYSALETKIRKRFPDRVNKVLSRYD